MLDDSIEIFFPIFQFGCLIAYFGFIFIILFFGMFKKGPPEAVKMTFSTFFGLSCLINSQME